MIRFITFDCYDTLVAYSHGKAMEIGNIVAAKGADATTAETVVRRFGEHEHALLAAPHFEPLETALRVCLKSALEEQKIDYETADGDRIVQAVKDSKPFADVIPVLKELKHKYKLAILSNSQPDIIRHNLNTLETEFDEVVLAAEVKAYKPDLRMFDALIDRCGCAREEIVHVAQGFYHDIAPSRQVGLSCVWINRNGHTADDPDCPDHELSDLKGLPELLLKLDNS